MHPADDDITKLSPEELHYQLDLLETALWKILGIKPRFFRPPFGEYDNKSLKVLQERGYSGEFEVVSPSARPSEVPLAVKTHPVILLFLDAVALWDFDSEDANGATPEESIESYKDMLRTFPTPHIALNHEVRSSA
jgi:peptidoglycan/xylan/chitin deacetylase (PgdA/CDA1 family)